MFAYYKFLGYLLIFSAVSCSGYPLFELFPTLGKKMGFQPLISEPTPIQKLSTLGNLVGAKALYIKRDDLTHKRFGGNKVRKLELLLGDALASGAKGVLTWGMACSNHTTATAIHSRAAGLDCVCMHIHQPPTSYGKRNLILSHMAGAELLLFNNVGIRQATMLDINKEYKEKKGVSYYFIPSGGSNEFGAAAYLNAFLELKVQIDAKEMETPDIIVAPYGSGGTAAGIALGIALLKLPIQLVIANVDNATDADALEKIKTLFDLTVKLLRKRDDSFPPIDFPTDRVSMVRYTKDGYAKVSQEGFNAGQLFLACEGIHLDGTYTSKTAACLLDVIAHNKDATILFWHTFYAPAKNSITDGYDYKKLPVEYHPYFVLPLQGLDLGLDTTEGNA